MSHYLTRFLIAGLVALLPGSSDAENCFQVISEKLDPGDSLRVTLADGALLAGHFAGLANHDLIFLEGASVDSAEPRRIPPDTLKDIRFRDRTRPVVIYAATGFVLGAITGALIADSSDGGELHGAGVAAAGFVGGAVGMIAGLEFPLKIPYTRLVECE